MEYDNEKRGVLFKNSKKETEKHPDYTGTVTVDGVEYQLAAWIRQSKTGKPFMSLSLSEKQERKESKPEPFQDDVPF
jgi:uncharacterized protein (DUF736 family)